MGQRPAAPLRSPRALVVAGLAAALLAGCTPAADPAAEPAATKTATPTPTPTPRSTPTPPPTKAPSSEPAPALDDWTVGASPLPLRPDGFGQVRRTPRELRVRRMPTADLLPAPRDGRFHGTVGPITPQVRRRMGETWSPSCPVPLSGLRYVTVGFHGYDGKAHTGELVVNSGVARDVVVVFHRLWAARFPIEEMRLVTTADLDAPPTGDGSNTASYVCRATRGTTTWSSHAYGLAIDVNPFVNPYRKGDLVLPELASAYLDRSWKRPGMVLPGGVVTRAFAAVGWTWGGDFESVSDLMHFSADGR